MAPAPSSVLTTARRMTRARCWTTKSWMRTTIWPSFSGRFSKVDGGITCVCIRFLPRLWRSINELRPLSRCSHAQATACSLALATVPARLDPQSEQPASGAGRSRARSDVASGGSANEYLITFTTTRSTLMKIRQKCACRRAHAHCPSPACWTTTQRGFSRTAGAQVRRARTHGLQSGKQRCVSHFSWQVCPTFLVSSYCVSEVLLAPCPSLPSLHSVMPAQAKRKRCCTGASGSCCYRKLNF